MKISPGVRLGSFQILALLGAGGMGEVYRARDTRLGRDVALKFLAERLAQDPERLARLTREAHLLASLSHPNIAAIYGIEDSHGSLALVLELVEGPSLADRLAVGPLPLEEALGIALQMSEAVEAAHARGVIHRDLKPANVKVTPDGTVKVLDFGLAKVLGGEQAAADVADLSTVTAAATRAGVILGTPAYMSPEQAKGQAADRRSDIWAFGCILFELLTGRRAFDGDTASEVLAKVLERDPDWGALPVTTPPGLARLVRRCLQKDPKRRLHDIADARLEMEDVRMARPAADDAARVSSRVGPWRQALPWTLAALMGVVAVGSSLWGWRHLQPASPLPVHLQVVLPAGTHLAVDTEHPALALSPDGLALVFVGEESGVRRLYLRDLSDPNPRAVAGTEGAMSPFLSPDGAWVGFFDGNMLKKVPLHGGVPVAVHTVTGTGVHRGATWAANDSVILAASPNSGLRRGSVAGDLRRSIEDWAPITKTTEPYAWPDSVPSGGQILFTDNTAGDGDEARVAVLSPQTGEMKVLFNGGTNPRYSPAGHILFARSGSLYAVPFDTDRVETTGPEQKLLDAVIVGQKGAAQFDVAANNTLIYVIGSSAPGEHELVWVDRQGRTGTLLDNGRRFFDPRLSPDGTRLAVVSPEGANYDLWLLHLARGTFTRLTSHPGEDLEPVWSPDGKRLALASEIAEEPEDPGPSLAWMTGSNELPEQLLRRPGFGNWDFPSSWSPDGRWLAFVAWGVDMQADIYVLPTSGPSEPRPFLQTPANETAAMFSPDGRWIAYVSDDSGQDEVYVRPFPGPGERIEISTDSGVEPLWSRDGRELFYREGNKLMLVKLATSSTLAASAPQVLFEGRFEKEPQWGASTANYDVTSDGRHFVMVRRKNPLTPTVIQVVLNWPEALLPRAPRDAR